MKNLAKINIIKTRVNAPSRPLTMKFEYYYEDFPTKTIEKIVCEDSGMIGVYLARCKSQDFNKYVQWLEENFGSYGGAWETGAGGSNRIYFTHEKYYNWFMLKWG